MDNVDILASKLQSFITEKDSRKPKPYDTSATVTRVDGDTLWVHIPGGVEETPVKKTINAIPGDSVRVHVENGGAWTIGNSSAPPTDDRQANIATNIANTAQDTAINAQLEALNAKLAAEQAKADAEVAHIAAEEAKTDAATAHTAANEAVKDAATAKTAATEAKAQAKDAETAATEAKTQAKEAETAATEAKDAAAKANATANGAVTSLGIVQGVVDDLGKDMDDMQTHVAMMDAVGDIPAGLHVVPTSNGYFVVLSNNGMYVYDSESVLVATFGENIKFNSYRPQRIGGEDAYIEYYDSNHDGKADSIRIVGATISSSSMSGYAKTSDIPTKVSQLTNDKNYADTTAVADAKKAGTDAQSSLNTYKTSNDTRVQAVEDANSANAKDLADYILSNGETIKELEKQIDGAIDTWYYAVDPTTSNEPAKNWTTDTVKESHLRDLYFNTSNGHTWRWAKEGNAYKWIQIEDADAIKALADAAAAQSTANVKKRVFVAQPTPPYDVGDLWVGGSTGDIKKCKTSKTSSQSYASTDWELASKYTDDSNLNEYKTTVANTYSTKVEVSQTKESLEGKISSAENSTKTYADGLIEQEVTDRNAAIKASADSITSTVSKTYAKTTDIPTKVSELTNDSNYATTTQAREYATTAETNAKADATTKANTAEQNAKADTANKLKSYSTTVEMNSAISQSASSIMASVSETYTTKEDFNNLSIGGRNLLRHSKDLKNTTSASDSLWFREPEVSVTYSEELDMYKLETPNATTSRYGIYQNISVPEGTTVTLSATGQSIDDSIGRVGFGFESYKSGTSGWPLDLWFGTTKERKTLTKTTKAGTDYIRVYIYVQSNTDKSKFGYVSLPKLEIGNIATDWTPAPEDLEEYTDTQVTAAKAEIKVTTDGISTEVSKKVGNDEVISKIRQSAETVKIQASKIEVDGNLIIGKSAAEAAANTAVDSLKTDLASETGTTVISGDHIVTGTIDTDKVNIGNLTIAKVEDLQDALTDTAQDAQKSIDGINKVLYGEDEESGLQGLIKQANDNISDLSVNYSAIISQLNSYMEFGEDSSHRPVLTLGSKDSDFRLSLTNDMVQFLFNDAIIAYMTGRELRVQEQLSFGNFVLYQRDNGHLTIRYIGGDA